MTKADELRKLRAIAVMQKASYKETIALIKQREMSEPLDTNRRQKIRETRLQDEENYIISGKWKPEKQSKITNL